MSKDIHTQRSICHLFYYLKIVGIVAFAVGGLAFATLLLLLVFISDNSGGSYWEIVKSANITRQSLGSGMLLAGLFLVGAAAAITWLASLYASFRFAGPLYRFSHNMIILIRSGTAPLIPIRKDDQLQQEALQIEQSVKLLQDHYREIGAATESALAMIAAGQQDIAKAVAKLRELERHVQL